ncbi:MAG TPA: nitroreductase family protein [Chloroflexota bacterium]|nr:nitroreductase family protein [Chloroflexota bacterium]
MDTFLAIASLRAVREYADRPLSEDSIGRILEAARATGSSQNKQPWRFYVVGSQALRERLAEAVYAPENLRRCALAVAIAMTSKSGFDAGRVAQDMMLAAWDDGIGSVPNGIRGPERVAEILALSDAEAVATILSFGYPAHARGPVSDAESHLGRIKRKPVEELVVRLD